MKASDLNERIDIYEQVTTRTLSGAVNIDWQLKYSCRARVNYSSGNRIIDNDEIFYTVDRDFIVRSYVPVVDTDEIRWQDKRWQIRTIDKNREYNNIVIKTTLVNE
jgi:head-tail adaptor